MLFFTGKRKKKHGVLRELPLEGSDRCAACSADCCYGFPRVELEAQEYSLLESIGARRLEFTLDGHFYLLIENGCEFLVANRCGIYEMRPSICRRFTCED